jgi:hypothetical protein
MAEQSKKPKRPDMNSVQFFPWAPFLASTGYFQYFHLCLKELHVCPLYSCRDAGGNEDFSIDVLRNTQS